MSLEKTKVSSWVRAWCSLLHTLKWKDFKIKDEEKNIVAYILKNARQLKTADISACKRYSKKERSQKLSDLVSLPRGSSSCQLMLDWEKLVVAMFQNFFKVLCLKVRFVRSLFAFTCFQVEYLRKRTVLVLRICYLSCRFIYLVQSINVF